MSSAAPVVPPGDPAPSAYSARRSSHMPVVVAAGAGAVLLVVLFLTGVIPGLSDDEKAQPASGPTTGAPTVAVPAKPTPSPVWAKLTPEDLLAAAFVRSEVEQLLNKPNDPWWPELPAFGGPPLPDPNYPGERFWARQKFSRVNGPEWLAVDYTLFPDVASATDCFASLLSTAEKGATVLTGAAVGDEQRYFTFTYPGDITPNESSVRFRVGPVITRISWGDRTGFQTPATMARYATALIPKLTALLAGKAAASAIRQDLVALLPPTVPGVAPVLGTAAAPSEAWNYRDNAGKLAKGSLYEQGILSQIAFRRYSLAADPTQVVEVTLFPFKDAASARAYMTNQVRIEPEIARQKLDPGKTGQVSGFFLSESDTYWLEFAAGAFAAAVQCFSPEGDASPLCEAAVRQVGEAWYPRLSTAAPLTR